MLFICPEESRSNNANVEIQKVDDVFNDHHPNAGFTILGITDGADYNKRLFRAKVKASEKAKGVQIICEVHFMSGAHKRVYNTWTKHCQGWCTNPSR